MEPSPPLTLGEAQKIAWMHQNPQPATTHEALGRLEDVVSQCLKALEAGQIVTAQSRLEESLVHILVAMKTLNLNPDQSLNRALARLKQAPQSKAFHVFSDHVEIRVQGEKRGDWPLYSQADYEAMLRLALELGCNIIHEEADQLGLFEHVAPTYGNSPE